jgi:signal transduction histidine kinase
MIVFTARLYQEHKGMHEIKRLSTQYEAESIANFLVAFRTTYQEIFLRNHASLNKQNIDFLPVRTTNEIAKIFSSLSTKSKISTVSDRPRNPINLANKRQLEVINYFKTHKDKESYFQAINDVYYYSQPLYITKKCLKCHGSKEEAPKIIKENYDLAYDYELGDLRGIIDIEVRQTKLGELLESNHQKRELYVFLLLLLILAVTFIYTKYNMKLSQQILNTTQELEKVNHTLEDRIKEEIEKNRAKDQKLFQQSRLAQMGELISMIAHQWRQPLSTISSTVINMQAKIQMGRFDFERKEDIIACQEFLEEKLENIDGYVQGLSTTIDDFRNFYNPNKERKVISINEPIEKSLDIIKNSLLSKGIRLETVYQSSKMFAMADSELMQVFLNILKNAEDNFKEKELNHPTIVVKTYDIKDGVCVEISDNGGGIPHEIITKIFDPYFSTKNEKNGTGLGLYMSKTIIEEHHDGMLEVENRGEGVTFIITIKDTHLFPKSMLT